VSPAGSRRAGWSSAIGLSDHLDQYGLSPECFGRNGEAPSGVTNREGAWLGIALALGAFTRLEDEDGVAVAIAGAALLAARAALALAASVGNVGLIVVAKAADPGAGCLSGLGAAAGVGAPVSTGRHFLSSGCNLSRRA
jgi:hypothetical protein